jgi:hypothetical protein
MAAGENDGDRFDLGMLGHAPDWASLGIEGPPWSYFDSETLHGRKVWDLRRQVLDILNIQTSVTEWEANVSAGVPVELSNLSQSS